MRAPATEWEQQQQQAATFCSYPSEDAERHDMTVETLLSSPWPAERCILMVPQGLENFLPIGMTRSFVGALPEICNDTGNQQ